MNNNNNNNNNNDDDKEDNDNDDGGLSQLSQHRDLLFIQKETNNVNNDRETTTRILHYNSYINNVISEHMLILKES